MGLFSGIGKAALATVMFPVAAVQDSMTLGGLLTDKRQTYTGENAERFSDAISEAFDDRKPKRRNRW